MGNDVSVGTVPRGKSKNHQLTCYIPLEEETGKKCVAIGAVLVNIL